MLLATMFINSFVEKKKKFNKPLQQIDVRSVI